MIEKRYEVILDNDGDGTPEDDRSNEYDASQPPFSSICKTWSASGAYYLDGSGFLISEDAVLTAAHNIYDVSKFGGYTPRVDLEFENGEKYSVGSESLRVNSNWMNSRSAADDYGVILLKGSIASSAPITLSVCEETDLNSVVTIAGYDDDHAVGNQHKHSSLLHTLKEQLIFYSVDTYSGQSGSPILRSTMEAIGVHTDGVAADPAAGDNSYNYGTRLTKEKISQIHYWAKRNEVGV